MHLRGTRPLNRYSVSKVSLILGIRSFHVYKGFPICTVCNPGFALIFPRLILRMVSISITYQTLWVLPLYISSYPYAVSGPRLRLKAQPLVSPLWACATHGSSGSYRIWGFSHRFLFVWCLHKCAVFGPIGPCRLRVATQPLACSRQMLRSFWVFPFVWCLHKCAVFGPMAPLGLRPLFPHCFRRLPHV